MYPQGLCNHYNITAACILVLVFYLYQTVFLLVCLLVYWQKGAPAWYLNCVISFRLLYSTLNIKDHISQTAAVATSQQKPALVWHEMVPTRLGR